MQRAIKRGLSGLQLVLMQRAIKRGEIPASADVNTLPLVIPSMAAYRSLVQCKPFELAFLVSMVDVVVFCIAHDQAMINLY